MGLCGTRVNAWGAGGGDSRGRVCSGHLAEVLVGPTDLASLSGVSLSPYSGVIFAAPQGEQLILRPHGILDCCPAGITLSGRSPAMQTPTAFGVSGSHSQQRHLGPSCPTRKNNVPSLELGQANTEQSPGPRLGWEALPYSLKSTA